MIGGLFQFSGSGAMVRRDERGDERMEGKVS